MSIYGTELLAKAKQITFDTSVKNGKTEYLMDWLENSDYYRLSPFQVWKVRMELEKRGIDTIKETIDQIQNDRIADMEGGQA